MSEPDSPDTPPISMADTFARGARQHPRLTVLVLFMGLLLTVGTALMFAIFAYRIGTMGDDGTGLEAPPVSEQGGP